MGLFSKKKSTPSSPTKQDLKLTTSNESIKSGSSISSGGDKVKNLFKTNKSKNNDIKTITSDLQHTNIYSNSNLNPSPPQLSQNSLAVPNDGNGSNRFKKRVSTIIETEDNTSDDEVENTDDDEDNNENGSITGDSETDEDEEEDHLHPIKPKYDSTHHDLAKQLSTIMDYCGLKNSSHLTEEANKESQKTYSLLDSENKIKKLSRNFNNYESVIGEYQIQLIKNLSFKISNLVENKNCSIITCNKSLYQRYGVIRNVVGKGAYGLIKIINPDINDKNSKGSSSITNPNSIPIGKNLYVVKELAKRKDEKPNNYIERILSEFVISSTLNNKNIIETVDLMGTFIDSNLRLSQVMQCSQGGDLFSYLLTGYNLKNKSIEFMSLYEIDCFLKQISKGLKYMHNHGVSHCDLKLENILISYEQPTTTTNENCETKIILKLSDFGKSFVFRTAYDTQEQLINGNQGLIGSGPYIPPEEFIAVKNKTNYSSLQKDNWALGIIALVILNLRRHYYSGLKNGAYRSGNKLIGGNDVYGYSTGYLWQTTELKNSTKQEYKDKVFNEYSKKRMIADYENKTKEWLIRQKGTFKPINNICLPIKPTTNINNTIDDNSSTSTIDSEPEDEIIEEEGSELNELRVMCIYKLLDIDPSTRMTVDEFLKSDWMTSTEVC
ncbi:HAL5 [Candida pseudojiufengensis]|uniref:HAL5 n=1 Tax=Candida pseudojiufengensis TaxID=497109 RepID=UPI00222513D1|nr:HAL5 [Candida pseudojiufengensis]KAI5963734.1 HAL5 [Candida pseudojiufengensis]